MDHKKYKPYKSPAMLQKCKKKLLPTLVLVFRASFALGYLPKAWREVEVVYISKTGNKDPEQLQSYRPKSLTSFLLKSMEKLIDLHVTQKHFNRKPLHRMQYLHCTIL
jgi:hypothetical protein